MLHPFKLSLLFSVLPTLFKRVASENIAVVGCGSNEALLQIEIKPDDRPREIFMVLWDLSSGDQITIVADGLIPRGYFIIEIRRCLPANHEYILAKYDSDVDGFCCKYYGDDWYRVTYDGAVVKEGGEFQSFDYVHFGEGCLPPPDNTANCDTIVDFGSIVVNHTAPIVQIDRCLPANHGYIFAIFDSYGNGLCCDEGEGWYTVTYNGEIVKEGGKFKKWIDIVVENYNRENQIIPFSRSCPNGGAQLHSKRWCFHCPSFMGLTDSPFLNECKECLPDQHIQQQGLSEQCDGTPCPRLSERLLGQDQCSSCPHGTFYDNALMTIESDITTWINAGDRCVQCPIAYYERKRKAVAAENAENRHEPRGQGVHNHGWDDEHYDYILRNGEILEGRYRTSERIGKGTFGQVVRAFDIETNKEVAIKIIQSRRTFLLQARTEIDILTHLKTQDPSDQNNIGRSSLG